MSHEDIRYKVISSLKDSILQTINRIRESKPQTYSNLRQQLESYKQIIDSREDIPLIIRNEIIIPVGIPDIEVFGGRILIEVKVKPSEFGDGFEQLSKYVTFYPYAEYAIITDHSSWKFFRVENGKLSETYEIDLGQVIEEILVKGVKVPLSTEKVGNMFNPIVLLEGELYKIFKTYEVKNDALFKAYREIMKRLYEKASEEKIEELFIKHTLMQMIVSSCLTVSSQKRTTAVRACSGADIEAEIVLPYLKWWESLKGISNPHDKEFLNSLVESIYSRAMLLDWESGGEDDVFRMLYEILIDKETRRKIGEYYTPLWLVEYMIDKVFKDVKDLRGKTVLDPFCGSGTFLVTAFYKKIQEGENPDDAIREVIGFDINPLAVSIARAELMIAYQSKRGGTVTPLVFNTDSVSLLLHTLGEWKPSSFLDELAEIEKKIEYIDSPIYTSNEIDFSEMLKIEMILRDCFREPTTEDFKNHLKLRLSDLKEQSLKGSLTGLIITTLAEKKSIDAISRLIEKYGNGVWAVSITSLFAPHIIRKVKVDIVVTNPPWAQLTEPKGSYGELMRDKAKALLKGYEKTGQILNGSDISSILLHGCFDIAKCEVTFLMPNEVVYTADSYYGLGKVLTYEAVKKYAGEIIEVNYDAFQHGRVPCMIFVRKESSPVSCFSMNIRLRGKYSKALHLSDLECELRRGDSYSNYIEMVIAYTRTSAEVIREKLGVEEAIPMGDYIRGLLGGIKKKGATKYAGLVFDTLAEDKTSKQYSIRLIGTDTQMKTPEFFLSPYWNKLIYMGEVFPFCLNNMYNVLLSSKGQEDLKSFLMKHIYENMSEDDKLKVQILAEEVKQPEKIKLLESGKYYVIYRRSRTFTSFVLTPSDIHAYSENMKHGIILYDDCSCVITEDETIAHYYSALLNFLVHKVIEEKGTFVRHQYLRPLMAICKSDLEWINKEWQSKIAELGKKLHQETPKCFANFIRKGMRVEECFERLETCDETRELFESLIKTVDKNMDKKKLCEALKFVCKIRV